MALIWRYCTKSTDMAAQHERIDPTTEFRKSQALC